MKKITFHLFLIISLFIQSNCFAKEIINYDLFFDFDKDKDTSWEELIEEVKIFIEDNINITKKR